MIWSIAVIMHTKGKTIHVELRSKALYFILASSLCYKQQLLFFPP